MAKPMLVSVPLVLLLLDYWPLGRMRAVQSIGGAPPRNRLGNLGALLREKAPLFALAAASSWLTILAQRHGEAVVSVQRIGLVARAANALAALAAYLGKMVWPRGLTLFYPHVGGAPAWGIVALGAALAGLLVVALRLRRTHPALLAGLLWYVISLGPVLGLVQVGYQSMADRYTYLPYLGAFIALAWGAERLAARSGRTAVAAAFGASILLMAVVAHRQVGYWRDGIALFSRYVAVLNRDYLPAAPTGGAGGERRYHERIVAVLPRSWRATSSWPVHTSGPAAATTPPRATPRCCASRDSKRSRATASGSFPSQRGTRRRPRASSRRRCGSTPGTRPPARTSGG